MKSKQENDAWLNHIQAVHENHDVPGILEPPVSWDLARHIWESENSIIEAFRREMIGHVYDGEQLRKHLNFDLMDSSLWSGFATLIYSLIERDDISNVDFVIRRVTEFVTMCPIFYHLRFGPEHPLRNLPESGTLDKEDETSGVDQPPADA